MQDSRVDTPHNGNSAWRVLADARASLTPSFLVRGWVWLLSMLWVAIGAGGAVYLMVAFAHPGYGEGLLIPPTIEWPGEPQVINAVAVVAEVTWFLLAGPVLLAGFIWLIRLRGWRSRNWLRVAAWTGSWVAGLALVNQTGDFARAGLGGTSTRLIVGDLAVCAAWLALGTLMSWILAVPWVRRSTRASPSEVQQLQSESR